MMTKDEWIDQAHAYQTKCLNGTDMGRDYAESLYETYVEQNKGCEFTPEDAVSEDFSYWDN